MENRSLHGAVPAGVVYFAIVFAAGFALGVLRVLVLMPRLSPSLGGTIAILIELPFILTTSWVVCRRLIAHFHVADVAAARLLMGALAFALLITAEVLLATLGFGRDLAEQIHRYRKLPELLGLLGQLAFAAFPWVQLMLHRGKR